MSLTQAQLPTLKADILADPVLAAQPMTSAGAAAIASAYNLAASPVYYVWRSSVLSVDIYNTTSVDATNWSWTFYKNQSAVEQGAWIQMFLNGVADFSKQNLRDGVGVIFTGAAAANATHALAIGKRTAKRGEKLYAVGNGAKATPSTMGFEGDISSADVQAARELP